MDDEDTDELIAQLCTRIGMLMEDGSVIALTAGGRDTATRREALIRLQHIVAKIGALMEAAAALGS